MESTTNGKKGNAFERNLKGCLSFFVASAGANATQLPRVPEVYLRHNRLARVVLLKRACARCYKFTFDKTEPPEKQMEKQIKTITLNVYERKFMRSIVAKRRRNNSALS